MATVDYAVAGRFALSLLGPAVDPEFSRAINTQTLRENVIRVVNERWGTLPSPNAIHVTG